MKRYRTPKSRRKRRVMLLISALLFIGILFSIHLNVTNVVLAYSEAKLRSLATVSSNQAVFLTLSGGVEYDKFISVNKDSEGNITAITTSPRQINQIARTTALNAQEQFEKESQAPLEIPLGAFFGVEAWAGVGPTVPIKIIPVCSALCNFTSSFESAGINQTKHSIYLDVELQISVLLPMRSKEFTVSSQVLICESILVGKIPSHIFSSDIFKGVD